MERLQITNPRWYTVFKEVRFRRKITYFLLYSINLCGIFPMREQVRNIFAEYAWFIFATYSMLCFAGLGIIELFINDYDSIVYISVALNFLTSVVSFCNPLLFLYSKKTVVRVLPLIDRGFHVYEDEETFQIPEYSLAKLIRSQFKFILTILVIYLGMTLSPMFLALMLRDHEYTVFDLVYVGWSPFGIKTRKQFIISYMMQWMTTIPVYAAFISKTVFMNLFKREYRYQCDRLRSSLRTICERVPPDRKELLEGSDHGQCAKCDENEFLKRFAECQTHYQHTQRSLKYFSAWFNLIFACELTYGFVSFALIGYVLIKGTGNRGTDIKYLVLLGLFGGQLCYQCVISETLRSLEEGIITEVYDMAWYNQTPRVKKNIQIFINHLQNRQILKAFGIYFASIETFASIVKASYSYFSILKKIVDKCGGLQLEVSPILLMQLAAS